MQETTSATSLPSLNTRLVTFFHALLFVAGFSLVFIIGWGGTATLLGQAFGIYKGLLGKVGGFIILLFGLATLRVVNLPWINNDTRASWTPGRGGGAVSSVMMGVFFAAGWTPCIGTTLGAILTLSFSQQTAGQAMFLASGYAIGLGLPFLLIGLGMDRASTFVRRFRRHIRKIEIVNGILLITVGLMMMFDRMLWIAIWAQRNGLFLDLPFMSSLEPTYFIAILAGLISFLSPCVLPLVPAYVGYLGGKVIQESTPTR